jgi:hypothetical protein
VGTTKAGLHPADLIGWLDHDDEFFRAIEEVMSARGRNQYSRDASQLLIDLDATTDSP